MAKYTEDQLVWLSEFDNGDEIIPRQKARVLSADDYDDWVGYVVQVKPEDSSDDGVREIAEDQIEGPAEGTDDELREPVSERVAAALAYGR